MNVPIGGEPKKGLNIGVTPADGAIPPKGRKHHGPIAHSRDVLESFVGGPRGRSFGIVPETPVLTPVNPFLDEAFVGNFGEYSPSRGIDSELREMISTYIQSIKNNSSELLDIKDFYMIMAKLFPIATSLMGQMSKDQIPLDSLIGSLMDVLNEIQQEILSNPDLVDFPKKISNLIAKTDFKNPESFKLLAQAVETFMMQQKDPNLSPKTGDAKMTSPPVSVPAEKEANLLDSFASIVKTINTVQSFPNELKPEVMMLLMGSQTIKSQGLIGENISKLNQGLTDLTLNIATQLDLIPQDKELAAKNYLSSAIDQFLLGGILMGKTLVLRSNGKLIDANDSTQLQQINLEVKQEIKIFDQIPFSFLAFFVPFRDLRESPSKAVKEAKESLINLIRIMLRLVFILLAIQTGGSKLGDKGVELLLKENADYVLHNVDDLIFAFKKISETYGVQVKYPMEFAQLAKESLMLKKYPEFWENILKIFAKDTDLEKFVKETKDADPLYEVIHSLVNAVKVNESSIHLQSQG